MDDLAGLEWNASSTKTAGPQTATANGNYFSSFRATPPISGRSTPATNLGSTGAQSKPASPFQSSNAPPKDSFANLFASSSTASTTKNLSLAEQQRLLQKQKAKQAGESGLNSNDDAWARLGGGPTPPHNSRSSSTQPSRQSPAITGPQIAAPTATRVAPQAQSKSTESEDDILAAFNSDAPVDRSSHFPVPTSTMSSAQETPATVQNGNTGDGLLAEDDDPFGLGTSAPISSFTRSPVPEAPALDDDDILGDLAKPVSQLPPRPPLVSTPQPEPAHAADPGDRAVAELVDMGFPAEKAQRALIATEGDVQAAVSWLLTQAHAESRSKTHTPANEERQARGLAEPGRSSSSRRRDDARSSSTGDKDPGQMASELGASLWKGANSLWKTGKKQLNKTIQELNADGGDSSQPRWMRDASTSRPSSAARARPPSERQANTSDLTDEAMMLDSHDRPQSNPRGPEAQGTNARPSRDHSPALSLRPAASRSPQPMPAWQPPTRSKLSKEAVEEEAAQAYVSSARRRGPTPKTHHPEPDLLNGTSDSTPSRSSPAPLGAPRPNPRTSTQPPPTRPPAPIAVRPTVKARAVPQVSAIAMKSCNQHRAAGTAAFKRGDYGSAVDSYSSAVTALPSTHPLVILLFTNRATTRLKTGDTKGALADADAAIELIGPSRGAEEAIEVPDESGSGTSTKDMGQIWGKAMMRRAEALEHMERLAEAGAAWRDCVQAGVGGSTSIQGRNRCENAINAPRVAVPAARKPSAKSRASTRPMPARSAESAQAVMRLREAHKEAERVDDEKFRLADAVNERIDNWRKGKESNLRALLGSLDTVLWEGSGWKKVGMSELLVPAKVKIAYMKGIAKVHPDKLPTTATTEQTMISGAAFSTLNEAWDKFKQENGM